jgi:hypothetical protein
MHLNKFALAAALALAGASASATIVGGGVPAPASNNAEMVLVVWSATTQSSYAQDLGLTLSAFRASSGTLSFSAAATSIYTSSTLASATDAKWAVIGFDTYGDPLPDSAGIDNLSLLTTVSKTAAFTPTNPGMSGDQLQNATGVWGDWTGLTNQKGTHLTSANGSALVTVTDGAVYWLDPASGPAGNLYGNFAYNEGNAVGTSSSFYRFTATDPNYDYTLPVTVEKFGGQWSFDGTSVAYNAALVPEPGSYALLIAGLAAVGFVARRRA